MPDACVNLEIKVERKGEGAYICFANRDQMGTAIGSMPNLIKIEYEDG
jgi:hypothetical protein